MDKVCIPKLACFILLVFFVAACRSQDKPVIQTTAQSLLNNPVATPGFVVDSSGRQNPDECIEISQRAIWESGDTLNSLQDHLIQSIRITVDNSIELSSEEAVVSVHLAGEHIFGSEGEIIGSTGGPIAVCVPSSGLSSGLHIATVRFTSTSGDVYEYTWVFEVE